MEDCGAKDIIKGFYYKENGNTAICYDFNADKTRFVLDNEIMMGEHYGNLCVQSRLSVYEDELIYRTDYCAGQDYVMDYRSPMWVDRRVFNVLHDLMDKIKDDTYNHTLCPFSGKQILHYEERENGSLCWHNDGFK